MEDEKLIKTLHYMGINQSNYSLVAILPLIQVAWADGTIQPQERVLILKLAAQKVDFGGTGKTLLDNWLSFQPTAAYLQAGREVLLALASKSEWDQISINTLNDVLGFSWDVAKAAGGLFGLGSIETREKDALKEIAGHLKIERQDQIDAIFTVLVTDVSLQTESNTSDIDSTDESLTPSTAPHISFHLHCPSRKESKALIIFENQGHPLVYPLGDSPVCIGRSRDNEIQIRHDAFVSKVHCRISHGSEFWLAEDLDTPNGTSVNGQQIKARPLLGGERLKIGETSFDFILK